MALVVEVGAELRRWLDLRDAQAGDGQRTGVEGVAGAREGTMLGRRRELQGQREGVAAEVESEVEGRRHLGRMRVEKRNGIRSGSSTRSEKDVPREKKRAG